MRYNKRILQILAVLLLMSFLPGCSLFGPKRVKETEKLSSGIDVARYQGTIDWEEVAASGVEFAIVRVGYRGMTDGIIKEDCNARYNLQEAQKNGILLGAYFFSTAVTEEEAREEANWVADIISQYSITYPVAYDCEGYMDPGSRQYSLDKAQRTDIALAFLKTIEKRGYEGMFYSSKNEMEKDARWEISRIAPKYKIWVAQYPSEPYPATEHTSYSGEHQMWQYTMEGSIPGISQNVDRNIAYFGYEGANPPLNQEPPPEAKPDVEALMDFSQVQETVTAKEETALRDIPSQGEESSVLYLLKNGEMATRIAISNSGWSKVEFNGQIYYAVSSYLTTDMGYEPPPEYEPETDDGIETRFEAVNEKVTAKIEVNLRTLPSVEHPDCKVIHLLKNGEIVTRTGINRDLGWSRVEYNGQTLYCVSSMLTGAE